ncbi:MAG: TonB-dependent receptor [Pseudomonadales bacterium]
MSNLIDSANSVQSSLASGLSLLVLCLPGMAADKQAEAGQAQGDDIEKVTVYGEKGEDTHILNTTLDAAALERIPGTQDDALRAVITLPGVAVNNDFEGGVAIRGSRPEDNRYFLDFLPVGYLFHLTGLSVVDTDLVSDFTLYPAGFGPEYQEVVGAVISANTRDPAADGIHGLVDASLLDTGVVIEGPMTDSQRGYLSARVSYYDLIFGSLIEDANEEENEGTDIVQLPQYRDYRGRYQVDLGERTTLDFLIDGATDEVELLFDETASQAVLDPAVSGNHRFDIEYNRQGVVLTHTGHWIEEAQVGLGRIDTLVSGRRGGVGQFETRDTETLLRISGRFVPVGDHEITTGGSVSNLAVDYDIVLRDNGCTEFDVDCRFSDDELVTTRSLLDIRQLGFFLKDTIQLTDNIAITLGGVYTADDYLDRSRVEPRLRLDWGVSSRLAVSMSAGSYSQLPLFEYIEPGLGNPALDYIEADHYVLGFDYVMSMGLLLSFDVYYKDFENLVTSDPVQRYDNDGTGYAWGTELMVRKGLGNWSGWLALSYSESMRKDTDTGQQFPFDYDQPVIASLVAKHDWNERLSFSGRAAWHSGPPVTPITGGVEDPDDPADFRPVYGEINGDRLPAYFRLDLRADLQLTESGDASVYFELVNVTNRENVADYEYSADYSTRRNVEQLPMLVSVGIKKRW